MDVPEQARRPGHCASGDPINILANFFRFTPTQSSSCLQRYAVHFDPELPGSLSKQRQRVLSKAKHQISDHLGRFVFANTIIFSAQASLDFSVSLTFDNVDYTISIVPTGELTSPLEIKHFYNKFFNSLQGKLNLVMIGRKFYNPERPVVLSHHKLTVWPGYASSVGNYEEGCLLNIDISHRVLRTITVYDQIMDIKNRPGPDFRQAVAKLLVGASVLTLYNNKCYRVDDVDWDMSPASSFDKNGTSTDFKEYYSTRWGRKVEHEDQPMLKSKLKTMSCLLLPEFCVMTGLTDEIRSDFNIMRDLASATKKEPKNRLLESAGLVKTMQACPTTSSDLKEWGLSISSDPIPLVGRVIQAGEILMGDNASFRINEGTGNFDRDIQRKTTESWWTRV
jgi:aubergine